MTGFEKTCHIEAKFISEAKLISKYDANCKIDIARYQFLRNIFFFDIYTYIYIANVTLHVLKFRLGGKLFPCESFSVIIVMSRFFCFSALFVSCHTHII